MDQEAKRESFYEAVLEAASKGLAVLVRPGSCDGDVGIEVLAIGCEHRNTIEIDAAFSRIESRPRRDALLFADYVKSCVAKWGAPRATRADVEASLEEAVRRAAERDGRLG